MLALQNDFRCFDWVAAEKNENSTSHDLHCCFQNPLGSVRGSYLLKCHAVALIQSRLVLLLLL